MYKELTENEKLIFDGGATRASLWDRVGSWCEDAGQYVGGFCYGLFADCPDDC